MIEQWLLKWWPVITGLAGVAGVDCAVRIRAFSYLHEKIEKKVERADYIGDREEFKKNISDLYTKINRQSEKLSLITTQNELIVAHLTSQKEASDRADKHLRDIIDLIPKK